MTGCTPELFTSRFGSETVWKKSSWVMMTIPAIAVAPRAYFKRRCRILPEDSKLIYLGISGVWVDLLVPDTAGFILSDKPTFATGSGSIPKVSAKKLCFPGSKMILKRRSVKNTPMSPKAIRCRWFSRIFRSSQKSISWEVAFS